MYDPLVVDTFLSVYEQLAQSASTAQGTGEPGLITFTGSAMPKPLVPQTSEGLSNITASTAEMLVLYDLAQGLIGRLELADAADIIAKHLRRIVPASTCVFFLYDSDRDELAASYAFGDNAPNFSGLRIPRGQRLTGWVAANKQTILNSDPVLDFGEAARQFKPRLKSCLSTPLLSDAQLVGVLTVYSTVGDAFTDDHRRLIEVVARQVSQTIRSAREFDQSNARHVQDDSPELPRRDRVERFVAAEIGLASGQANLSIILIDIPGLKAQEHSRPSGPAERQIEEMLAAVTRILRGADILCRYSDDQFVVILCQTDSVAAMAVAGRLIEILANLRLDPSGSNQPTCGVASAPDDGLTLPELVGAARGRKRSPAGRSFGRPPAVH
jgi:diguanylate cyclase (GGDEF)-like protein